MKFIFLLIVASTFLCSTVSVAFGQRGAKEKSEEYIPISSPISMVNSLSFLDPELDKTNVGNSFLVRNNDKTYAITAKHVLMLVKTSTMDSVAMPKELTNWSMHPKGKPNQGLIVSSLLNENREEKLSWENPQDWLVFKVNSDNFHVKPLEFRQPKLKVGESLYVVGWSYQDMGRQPTYHYKFVELKDGFIEAEQISGPDSLAGLSGSALVDAQGQLVGVVSSGGTDEKTGKVNIWASDRMPIKSFLDSLHVD